MRTIFKIKQKERMFIFNKSMCLSMSGRLNDEEC